MNMHPRVKAKLANQKAELLRRQDNAPSLLDYLTSYATGMRLVTCRVEHVRMVGSEITDALRRKAHSAFGCNDGLRDAG